MRPFALALLIFLTFSSSVQAASYQKNDGTIVDPILLDDVSGTPHPYTGANLEPSADLEGADLTSAFLFSANLTQADLSNANLSNTTLAFSTGLPSTFGSPFYDLNTDFFGTGFDPVAAGWTLVPEPGTALLMGLGLAGLAGVRKRATA